MHSPEIRHFMPADVWDSHLASRETIVTLFSSRDPILRARARQVTCFRLPCSLRRPFYVPSCFSSSHPSRPVSERSGFPAVRPLAVSLYVSHFSKGTAPRNPPLRAPFPPLPRPSLPRSSHLRWSRLGQPETALLPALPPPTVPKCASAYFRP